MLVGAFAAPAVAHAQDGAVPIELKLRVVYAERTKGEIDPEVRDLQSSLPMTFGTLRLMQSQTFQLVPGRSAQFELPTGRAVQMMPVSVIDSHVHLHFQMAGVMNTRLRMTSGRPVIVGGEKQGKGHLILVLTPTFSPLEGPESPPSSAPVQQASGTSADSR